MAHQKAEILSCPDCPVLLEVVNPCEKTSCEIQCSGNTLSALEEKTADKSTEKHVPVVEKVDGGYKVTVGTTLHPMTDEHWIQWIELHAGKKLYRQYLDPGDEPIAEFQLDYNGDVTAREHCNVHGLWKG